MRIRSVAVLAALLLTAQAAPAQWTEATTRPRFVVSAYTGVRAPFTTGAVNIYDPDGELLLTTREQRGGNPVLGVEAEAHVRGPLSAIVGGTYSQGGISEFFLDRDPGEGEPADFGVRYTGAAWFAKAGASLHFEARRRAADARLLPSTDLTIAPALVRQFDTNHPALNLGFEGAFPVGSSGVGVTVGLEDYLVFWDDEALGPVTVGSIGTAVPDAAFAEYLYQASHILVIRLGASMRF